MRQQGLGSAHPLIGVGLRPPHYPAFLTEAPPVGWLEVHSENYFAEHSQARAILRVLAERYPISLHGVGMSLGSHDPLDCHHLAQLKQLADEIGPVRISEHLSWSSVAGRYYNDLLPLPYTGEALVHFCGKVSQVQEALGRPILIENPSSYLLAAHGEWSEWDFLAEVQRRTGCGLLLDLNNLYVSAHNHGFDSQTYLAALDPATVGEIHLAGYTEKQLGSARIFIDTHSAPVVEPVWALYRDFVRHHPVATLIEWDLDIPPCRCCWGRPTRLPPSWRCIMSALLEWQLGMARALQGEGDEVVASLLPGPVPAAARLQIYRNHLILSLSEALEATYPAVRAMVGEEFFAAAARAFVQATPLTQGCLMNYGAGFADLLVALPTTAALPWLGPLADFEWQRDRVALLARDERRLTPAALAALATADLDLCRLELAGDLRLLHYPCPVPDLWALALEQGAPPADLMAPCWLLLRKGKAQEVQGQPLAPELWQLLSAIDRGESLGSLATQAHFLGHLSELVAEGWVVGWHAFTRRMS